VGHHIEAKTLRIRPNLAISALPGSGGLHKLSLMLPMLPLLDPLAGSCDNTHTAIDRKRPSIAPDISFAYQFVSMPALEHLSKLKHTPPERERKRKTNKQKNSSTKFISVFYALLNSYMLFCGVICARIEENLSQA
jgi:hypothetical protein